MLNHYYFFNNLDVKCGFAFEYVTITQNTIDIELQE